MRHSSLRCGGSLCKVQDDNIHLPLIGEGWDGEYPVRALLSMRHSSLRCGGWLCKVQDDKMHLPLIGEGWDGEYPVRALLSMRHSGWIFGRAMRERMRTKPVRWRKTMSFPTARIIQIRAGVSYKFRGF